MPIVATYGEMQRAIADEIGNRTDLLVPLSDSGLTLSPIQYAIQSAIAKWEREPFYFNEEYEAEFFTTVAGQELYTQLDDPAIKTWPYIVNLHINIANNRWQLARRSWQELDLISMNPQTRGQPSDWAYFSDRVRLYPIPDNAYVIRGARGERFVTMDTDGDETPWTTDGYDLIRSEAKLILASEVLMDDDLANRMRIAIYGNPLNPRERGYLSALKAEGTRRGKSRIRATMF